MEGAISAATARCQFSALSSVAGPPYLVTVLLKASAAALLLVLAVPVLAGPAAVPVEPQDGSASSAPRPVRLVVVGEVPQASVRIAVVVAEA